jgi:sugar transferase (PEP-CTERM/EpsH1 system associated)
MTKRIHIQHVLLSLQPGGLENGVVNVINGLDGDRFRSSVTCLQEAGPFAARIRQPGVDVHTLGLRPGNDPTLPLRLARLFRRTGTDIVHTRNAEAFFYGFAGAKLGRVKSLIHSEHGRVLPDTPRRMRLQKELMRFTDSAFCVSWQLQRDLVKHLGVPSQRLGVIYNGVDVTRSANAERALARAVFGAGQGEVVIGSVGRLVPVKNYGLLVRAFSRLSGAPARLVFIGDGPERQKLEALAAERGANVKFLGHREDVAELLPGMDIFVLPSFSEGMSNTLLEAMAARVAVVASDVGGNHEIVRDGVSGLLFPNDDEDALLERLTSLSHDSERRAEFGRAANERVVRDFGMRTMIRNYEDLYTRVARGEKYVAGLEAHS